MFTIPESCPKELFPMNVYLSVGDLDIRNASGMELPVVREADNDWYSSGEISSVYQGKEPDYKFAVRFHFRNIGTHDTRKAESGPGHCHRTVHIHHQRHYRHDDVYGHHRTIGLKRLNRKKTMKKV